MKKKLNKIRKELRDLKQESEDKHTLDYYVDDDYMSEILEAYDNQDPEFLAEMYELEQLIIESDKPLMPWDLEES